MSSIIESETKYVKEMKTMKKFVGIVIVLIAILIANTFADTVYRDVYYYTYYDENGNQMNGGIQAHGASEEDALFLSEYIVFEITDADGEQHELWVVGLYYEKNDNGDWVFTGFWVITQQEIDDFFNEHVNN